MNPGRYTARALSVPEAAEYAGVSTKTIYPALEDQRLKHAMLGSSSSRRE